MNEHPSVATGACAVAWLSSLHTIRWRGRKIDVAHESKAAVPGVAKKWPVPPWLEADAGNSTLGALL